MDSVPAARHPATASHQKVTTPTWGAADGLHLLPYLQLHETNGAAVTGLTPELVTALAGALPPSSERRRSWLINQYLFSQLTAQTLNPFSRQETHTPEKHLMALGDDDGSLAAAVEAVSEELSPDNGGGSSSLPSRSPGSNDAGGEVSGNGAVEDVHGFDHETVASLRSILDGISLQQAVNLLR